MPDSTKDIRKHLNERFTKAFHIQSLSDYQIRCIASMEHQHSTKKEK